MCNWVLVVGALPLLDPFRYTSELSFKIFDERILGAIVLLRSSHRSMHLYVPAYMLERTWVQLIMPVNSFDALCVPVG